MAAADADVKCFEDLNRETLLGIFKVHFKSDDVVLTDVGQFETLDAGGEGACSLLKQVTIKYK